MIPFKSTLETIAKIEQSFDINSVSYKDLLLWPWIRLRIYQQLSHPELNFTKAEYRSNGEMPIINARKKQLEFLRQYKGTEILFFSRIEKHVEQVEGKLYNPFIDPMIDLVRDSHSYLKIELSPTQQPLCFTRIVLDFKRRLFIDVNIDLMVKLKRCVNSIIKKGCHNQKQIRFEPTTFIDPKFYRYETDPTQSINNFSNLQKTVKNISGIQIDINRFIDEARILKAWESYFTEILSEICPRAVFFECYYYEIPMALISACKKLGIKTVDIQHGQYGNYHGLYTHWTKIPVDGYNMLPDYFWSWGKVSENCISKWYPPDCTHHKPIVGGNVRLTKWIGGDDPIIDEKMKGFYEQLKQKEKIILVTMSKEVPLPEHVFDAMLCSPENWLWLIRLHPLDYNNDKVKQLQSNIQQRGIHNFEIDNASYCQLYGLLKRTGHHVTFASSTYYQALAFHVPTTIVHQHGLEIYEDDFKKGVLDYAGTGEALIASIKNGFKNKHLINPSDYIETSRQTAKNAIENILGHK